VAAEAAILVKDADFTPDFVADTIVPLVSDSKRIATMTASSALVGITDGAERLYRLVAGLKG
jgi:UDP-N-acetylglucosamine--N-acetylmuramyl-(pentapeptide) pyrophosphoryl-undecaprenol N-acetylglucosamine transferase